MKRELIKISEFQRRRWGENGTPQCPQAIRNHIRNGAVPGEQIGKLWYVDWTAFIRSDGNDLVAVLEAMRREGCTPRETLIFEDSPIAIEAARRSGASYFTVKLS